MSDRQTVSHEDGKKPQYARASTAARHFQIGVSTLWSWCSRPGFPKPVKAGPRVTLFDVNAIERFIQAQNPREAA